MPVTHSGPGRVSAYEVVHASREFRTLQRHFGSFVVPAIVAFLSWYFLYVILAAFAPGFMRISVFGSVTDQNPGDAARFARVQVRAFTGVGAERSSHN